MLRPASAWLFLNGDEPVEPGADAAFVEWGAAAWQPVTLRREGVVRRGERGHRDVLTRGLAAACTMPRADAPSRLGWPTTLRQGVSREAGFRVPSAAARQREF